MTEYPGILLVLSGPSAGAGKDTIARMFAQKHPDWIWPLSTTTRAPRQGEVHGRDMNFVNQDQFGVWQQEGEFLESDHHANHWYGTLREPVEKALRKGNNVLLRVDVNGSLAIKKVIPAAITVFIYPETTEALEQRLRARGTEDETQIQERLQLAEQEMALVDQFDFYVVNPTGHPEKAVAELEDIVYNQ